MASPFTRKVYLRPLEDTRLPAYFSKGARRRAAQVQRFLRDLHVAAEERLRIGGVALVVAERRDWAALSSYPYGFPLTRGEEPVAVLAPADYSQRLLHRFDAILVRASLAGAPSPGELREFFDLLIGVEWGHGVLKASGVATGQKDLNELLASYLFITALRSVGADATAERLKAWAQFQSAGSGLDELPLSAVRYPRAKMPLAEALLVQAVLTNRAATLAEQRGWALALEIWKAKASGEPLMDLRENLGLADDKLIASSS